MTTIDAKHSAFQLKGSLFTLTVLQLLQPEVSDFDAQLKELVDQAPKFFNHTPVVIDLQLLPTMHYAIDFHAMADKLRQYKMIPVGIRGGTPAQNEAAMAAGLAVMAISRQDPADRPPTLQQSRKAKLETPPTIDTPALATTTSAAQTNETVTTMTVTKPVRSGQQIYAKGGDLVVLAPVSPGAELLADGNIHVYAPLRGRALAGISGDENARIYCTSLEAQLVSVAGHYIINEALLNNQNSAPQQIFLEDGKLRIQPL